jgi:predicted ATPase/DNA-binding CsgD family transcriptional regulator/DNA-binding XRE family transcriptional regulator
MAKREPAPFGALLLRYRAASGLTQEQLAARAGLSPDAIAALERGKRHTPHAVTVGLLSDALGLDAQERVQFVAAARGTEAPERAVATSGAERGAGRDAGRRTWWPAGEPTPLVDRSQELDTILSSLAIEDVRLLTLTGPAGVGKTRLALAAAARLADGSERFPDGVIFVDLTPVRDPELVLSIVASAVGLLDAGIRPVLERLMDALEERQQLLVLDNFEQVLSAAAGLADLLAACPGLALLVTSRVSLRLRWEQTLRIAPLPVPDPTRPLPPLDELAAIPSVALFVQRARARQPDFVLSEQQAPVVARLVAQLDGLPLALELAAARTATLSLPVIAHRLGDRLRLLRWEAADVPERQRSLQAAVGWSYDLLSLPEQRLFRCLGVFVGRVALDAITAVASGTGGDVGDSRMFYGLASLAEKSLVLPGQPDAEDVDPEPAFGMLDTVREYARERLAAEGELESAQRAHAYYFLALAERADPLLRGSDQRAWFFRLEREHANLRAALRWLLDQEAPADREAALRLTTALCYFWWVRGYHAEAWRWQEEALRRAPAAEANPAVRTRALVRTGMYRVYGGELDQAQVLLEEALALAQRRQDPGGTAEALNELGARAIFAGDWAESARLLLGALTRWEAVGDPHYIGNALVSLGAAALIQGNYADAAPLFADALEQFEAAGDARIGSDARFSLGVIAHQLGDQPRAVQHVQEGLQASVTLQDRYLLSLGIWAALAVLGERADPAGRARLLGAADALSRATGATLGLIERGPGAQSVARLRDGIEQGEWEAPYRAGQALPFEEVAALALTMLDGVAQTPARVDLAAERPQKPQDHAPRRGSPLSEREEEVLRLVAQGLSSKVIGQQLLLSPSTVNHHLAAIFNKLGVDTRAQAVAVAAQRGLL